MLGLVGGLLVLVLVAGAAVALTMRTGDERGWGDVGSGPRSEPERAWGVDVDLGDQGTAVLSDGDRVFVIDEQEADDQDDEYTLAATSTVTVYDADDGTRLWDTEVTSSIGDTPVRPLGDDGVVVADDDDDDRTTRLLDPDTGDELWQADGLPVDTQLSAGFGPRIDPGDLDLVLLTDDEEDEPRVTAVDRASGDTRWDAAGSDAVVCGDVVVTIVEGESDGDTIGPTEGPITGRDPGSGDELWTRDALPGLCDEHEIALAGSDGEVDLVDVRSGDVGSTIELDDPGEFVLAIPFGDHVAISSYTFSIDDGEDADDSSGSAAIFPRDGSEPTWQSEGVESFVFPVTDEVALTAQDEGETATFIRAADGEEVGRLDVATDDNDCDGAFSREIIVLCESDSPTVTARGLSDGIDELWTLDVGADVDQVAVGGDRLFVVTADGELVAYG